jgi:hypothetical protein
LSSEKQHSAVLRVGIELAVVSYEERKNPVYTVELSQKSDFQSSTTKPDNEGHPTAKTEQV